MGTDSGRPLLLTLYSRLWCHLCDDMLEKLQAMQAEVPFELEILDVDSEPGLEAAYGELVPVLMHGRHRLCHYHLDSSKVTEYLRKFR